MAGSEFAEKFPLCSYHWHRYSNSMTWISKKSPSFKDSILFVRPRILIFDSENKVTVVTVALQVIQESLI